MPLPCACQCAWLPVASWCRAGDAAAEDGQAPAANEGTVTPRSTRSPSTWSPSLMRGLEERLLTLEVQRKLVVLGFRGVGKSALIARFVDNKFLDQYEPTIEYTHRTTLLRKNVRFVCDILDTSAQDEYSSLSRQASVGVHGYILVYSSISRTSFENVKVIHDKVLNVFGGATIPMVLVATKIDVEEFREVLPQEGRALAGRWGCPFIECSAKEDWGVDDVFQILLGSVEQETGLLREEQEESCTIL